MIMKKLSEICITVDKTNDNFVGVKYNKGNIKIIFPRGYEIPRNDEKECRKSVINLFKSISFAHEKKLEQEDGGDFSVDSDGMPVDSYLWILSDYVENGLYSDNEKKFIQQQTGKINWKKTFKTKFFVNKNDIVYLNPIVEQNSNAKNIITEIHSYCVDKSIDVIGPLYYGVNKINFITPTIKRIKYYFQMIQKEKLNSFDDRKKMLLFHLKRILMEQIDNGNNPIRNFGVRSYEHVWEYMVNSIFGDEDIKKYYPTTSYFITDREQYIPSKLRPDTIFVKDNNFYILDSKYYKFGITGKNKDLPDSSSIQKQVTYGEFIGHNFNLNNSYDEVYNAFIMPYNKHSNVFNYNDDIVYCGYASCDWKLKSQYDERYLKVAVILIDTKTLIDSYFDRNIELKILLTKRIMQISDDKS